MRRRSAAVNAHVANPPTTPYLVPSMVYELTIVVPTLNEAGNIDGPCADVIVQVGLLDEIVYG